MMIEKFAAVALASSRTLDMKAVILAGGLGTRIAEESQLRPKPMIEIGGYPILWHIMKIYAHYGVTDFVVCLGYKGYMIKEYFANYVLHNSNVTVNVRNNSIHYHGSSAEPWTVTLVRYRRAHADWRTAEAGRPIRSRRFVCMTYGDGVADIDIRALIEFHKRHGRSATLTAVVPPGRDGAIELEGEKVTNFIEKPPGDNAFINGGFFVLEPGVLDRIAADDVPFERAPLELLAHDGQLMAFRHTGFWLPMDTLRDKNALEALWASKTTPWKVWA